jgi:hypothetical protein
MALKHDDIERGEEPSSDQTNRFMNPMKLSQEGNSTPLVGSEERRLDTLVRTPPTEYPFQDHSDTGSCTTYTHICARAYAPVGDPQLSRGKSSRLTQAIYLSRGKSSRQTQAIDLLMIAKGD